MTTLTMKVPETVFSALHADPRVFTEQMRIAALSEARVSPLQITPELLREELINTDYERRS